VTKDETVVTHVPPSGKPASSRTSVPAQVGRYTIKRMLGRGGMGAVYEAEDPELARSVAIKMLRDDREGDTEALRREAQALAKLVHPNVVTVHDVGVHDGEVYLVMQLVHGRTIDRWLATHRMSADRVVELYRQAGEGLAAAHAAGLVHCDFKPGNILVDDHGHVRVTDFGLAKMARAEPGPAASLHIAGTPAYMAPEQFAGIATPQSDQFAFCVALWEALVGDRPFDDIPIDSGNPKRPPPRRSGKMPARFARVLERGMLDDPNARYPSMTELLADLEPRNSRLLAAVIVVPLVAAGVGAFFLLRETPIERVRDVSHVAAPTPLTTFGRVACAYAPAIEPGGKHVIFDRTEGEAVDLYTVPVAGNAPPRQLTSSPRWEWRAAPGRKPNEVVHLIHDPKESGRDPKIAYLDITTGAETIVLDRLVWDAVVAGDALYFTPDLPHGIRRRSLDGTRESELVKPPDGLRFILLAAAPHGKRIASVGSSADDGPVKPCVIDLATRELLCSPTNATPTRPAFGADGTTLYFAVDDEIRAFDIATRTETVIYKSAADYPEGGLAISPDGSALVLSTCYPHSAIVDARTQAPIVDDENATQPTIAADGTLAWVRITYRNRELVVRTPDGRRTQVTNIANESIHTPTFDAQGTALVFTASAPNPGIFVARLSQAGAIHQLTENQLDQAPLWLADGRVAFTRTDANGTDHIFTISADGGTPTPLTTSSRKAFAARGNDLLVYSAASGHIYWLDVTTKEERPGPQQPDGELQNIAISPSGNWIAYQLGANGQSIYRARLDPPGAPEHVHEYAAGQTVGPPTIDDTGRVLATPATWYGDLFVLRPKSGYRF
jgi:Tol biopolymer transport system component